VSEPTLPTSMTGHPLFPAFRAWADGSALLPETSILVPVPAGQLGVDTALLLLWEVYLAGAAAEREAAATLAEGFMNFTGSAYCDVLDPHPEVNPNMHDYGRGGCDVRRAIAAAIRARGEPSAGAAVQ
jgi:hypothetical protein